MSELREGDDLIYLSPNECAVILHEREADALLGVLETALNDGVKPGIGLRVEDARAAGFKRVSERFRDQDPYNRGARVVAVAFRDPAAALAVEEDAPEPRGRSPEERLWNLSGRLSRRTRRNERREPV